MLGKIYILRDPENLKIRYVGQTIKTLEYRLNEHIQDSKRHKYHNANWIKSILKRNLKPLIELLEECELDKLNEREIYYIAFLSIDNNLNNIQKGGREGSFIKHDEKAKRKISEFMRTYKKSQEHIDKMTLALSKPVHQYDLEGNFIKTFVLQKEFEEIGILKDTITSACRREGTSNGYNWRYYKKDKIIPKIPYFKK